MRASHCKAGDRYLRTRVSADNQDFYRSRLYAKPYSQNPRFFLRLTDTSSQLLLRLVCLGYTHPRPLFPLRNFCRSLQLSEPLQRTSPHFKSSLPILVPCRQDQSQIKTSVLLRGKSNQRMGRQTECRRVQPGTRFGRMRVAPE